MFFYGEWKGDESRVQNEALFAAVYSFIYFASIMASGFHNAQFCE